MSLTASVTVTVPATTANLGPGFDCIGAALTLYNEFKFSRFDPPQPPLSKGGLISFDVPQASLSEGGLRIMVTGMEAERVKADESNLAYQAFVKLYQHIGQPPPSVEIQIHLGVPLARGLGSSATAIVGGLVGANLLAGSPLSHNEVMQLAIALEGHPDNVVPALLGGCRLAATGLREEDPPQPPLTKGGQADESPQPPLTKGGQADESPQPPLTKGGQADESPLTKGGLGGDRDWEICEIPWHSTIIPIVAIPDFELSTAEARRVLPTEYSRGDAIFNTAHLGLLVRGLETGCGDWLQAALQDKIHQPYRKALIKGYDSVRSAALAAGAYGMVISGAGPTLLALADATVSSAVGTAMADAWQEQGVKALVRSLQIDFQGAKSNT